MEKEYYTPKQIADKFQVSLKTITKHTQDRRIPGQVKIGGRWRYAAAEIEKAVLSGSLLLPKNRGR